MAALGKNRGPYALDVVEVQHRGHTVTTIVNSPVFDNYISNIGKNPRDYEVGVIPAGYEHRPDLISNVYFGNVRSWWLLMLVNGITDPFEGFKLQERISVPKPL